MRMIKTSLGEYTAVSADRINVYQDTVTFENLTAIQDLKPICSTEFGNFEGTIVSSKPIIVVFPEIQMSINSAMTTVSELIAELQAALHAVSQQEDDSNERDL